MKKSLLFFVLSIPFICNSQEHFSGLTTSSRVGLLTASINPAELVNMSNTFEINGYGVSANVSNNKIGFNDIISGSNIEKLIFTGLDPVNMRFDAEVFAIGFAMKYKKWGLGITSKANAKLDIVDVDPRIGDAITNAGLNTLLGATTTINNNFNQRINGTTWGEVGITISRSLMYTKKHKVNIGATFKMLFPGSYANLGADKFSGKINQVGGQAILTDANANLNFSYSGGLANSFSNFDDYSKSLFGKLNGFVGDIGFNYQLREILTKDDDADVKVIKKNKYKINLGLSVRNIIGSMTFKDENNRTTNYNLSIQGTQSLNLNQFDNVDSLKDIENVLLSRGYLTQETSNKDFVVKLPTTISGYIDLKLIPKIYLSGYIQQRMIDNSKNDQITAQNIITITPRVNIGFFEAYIPISNSDISGFNTGFGFRLGGFYLGSGSIVTALINDSKQADIYTGFRWGFL